MKRVAIIGGGISGLAAAIALHRARRHGAEVQFTVFDRSARLGGVMVTDHVDGCLIEAGPDSFLTEKEWGLQFCRSLGLGDEIIGSNDAERKTYILVNGRLVAMPDGLMFMVPTKLLPTALTPLFSWGTKIRMGFELLRRSADHNGKDETVAELVERHFGSEVVERLADPLLAGVYGGDAASLSARAVLPRFVDMETRYGSLSRGMLAARKKMAAMVKQAKAKNPNYAPRPLFSSLKEGMQQLIDAIQRELPADSLRLNTDVSSLSRSGDEWRITENNREQSFDAVIMATPAWAAGALLAPTNSALADDLSQISYSSSVTVTLGYMRDDLRNVPPGFGFLVPRNEGKRMLACTFVHNKFPHRAPPDRGIVRVFLGGLRDEAVLALSDDEILKLVRRELKEIVGLTAEPRWQRLYRWHRSMAQYGPGHLARIERIKQAVQQTPGLALAGNAYHGIGVPDCIHSGQQAAAAVVSSFGMQGEPIATAAQSRG